jgi:hypothetical protein
VVHARIRDAPYVLSSSLYSLQSINTLNSDTLFGFDIVSLPTNIPAHEALNVTREKLHSDNAVSERFIFQVETVIKLLEQQPFSGE